MSAAGVCDNAIMRHVRLYIRTNRPVKARAIHRDENLRSTGV
jgi:hypothetical protein